MQEISKQMLSNIISYYLELKDKNIKECQFQIAESLEISSKTMYRFQKYVYSNRDLDKEHEKLYRLVMLNTIFNEHTENYFEQQELIRKVKREETKKLVLKVYKERKGL